MMPMSFRLSEGTTTMNKTTLILAAIALGLTGCVNTPETDPYRHIQVVDSDAVTSCKLVGNLSASSMAPYGLFSGTAHETVVELGRKEGFKLGATHVVLNAPTTTGDTVSLTGKAYVCP
ncbi:MAG: hypothetical protein A3J37_03635 [Alphaproteobacteria bacterium RIFCSPHIGHO2_12_FULL_45_9]|nr:MAG: hypothetical protein A3B66_01595 [Alphaproteobacteria bacterium RIFCSPHIGHO2_02_FULL_46_13]OFW98129.1 MAG: hypothetical protein A3J37_03635 [Alphaproteobacteria bacterium RIFCSPHIGHO2_12_FULL_45_9]